MESSRNLRSRGSQTSTRVTSSSVSDSSSTRSRRAGSGASLSSRLRSRKMPYRRRPAACSAGIVNGSTTSESVLSIAALSSVVAGAVPAAPRRPRTTSPAAEKARILSKDSRAALSLLPRAALQATLYSERREAVKPSLATRATEAAGSASSSPRFLMLVEASSSLVVGRANASLRRPSAVLQTSLRSRGPATSKKATAAALSPSCSMP
mmetsp:Transcript_58332/g.126097  ORF Transcript_58332/g.126097 Transcript_58332/m.126097 type:complete len:209 (+) Transcript_58332:1833-2459(+)